MDLTRRRLALSLATAAFPGVAAARAQLQTLRIGLDIADTVTLDPPRQTSYTPGLALAACYDTLVTLRPGTYDTVAPRLATRWERTPDQQGWRFFLDPTARFSTGQKVTPEDCRFSLERARGLSDGAGQFLTNLVAVTVSGPDSIDLTLGRPKEPLLGTLAAPDFAIMEQAVVEAHGGPDRATEWLNQNSAGSGPYVLTGWARRQSIRLAANPRAWRAPPGFGQIVIQHMPYPVAQFRALQRGDIDVAFNLIPEQIVALGSDRAVRIENIRSLDCVYLALCADPSRNPALANEAARQAIGAAIDYDDLLGRLLGGKAVRPAHFLPIGVQGSTEAEASAIGFRQDLDRARALLRQAGLPDGLTFELSYGDDAIAGISYAVLARKLQTDLGRVGIRVRLNRLDPVMLRNAYREGKLEAALAFWAPPVIENQVWAAATLDRLAQRLGWSPPDALRRLAIRRRDRARHLPAGRALGRVPDRDGRGGDADRAVPADLPGRGTDRSRRLPADRGGLAGRSRCRGAAGREDVAAAGMGFHAARPLPTLSRMTWSPQQYTQFEDDRTRPVRDLVAAIPAASPSRVIDLGCGPGNSTEVLAARFPAADVTGHRQLAGDDRRRPTAFAAVPLRRRRRRDLGRPGRDGRDPLQRRAAVADRPRHAAAPARRPAQTRRQPGRADAGQPRRAGLPHHARGGRRGALG